MQVIIACNNNTGNFIFNLFKILFKAPSTLFSNLLIKHLYIVYVSTTEGVMYLWLVHNLY